MLKSCPCSILPIPIYKIHEKIIYTYIILVPNWNSILAQYQNQFLVALFLWVTATKPVAEKLYLYIQVEYQINPLGLSILLKEEY